MFKTAGHVAKHYKPCCIIFEDFKNRGGSNATIEEYVKAVEHHAAGIKDLDARMAFKGDMLEILAEMFFKAFANDPRVGLKDKQGLLGIRQMLESFVDKIHEKIKISGSIQHRSGTDPSNPKSLQLADRIIVLRDGRVALDRPAKELSATMVVNAMLDDGGGA